MINVCRLAVAGAIAAAGLASPAFAQSFDLEAGPATAPSHAQPAHVASHRIRHHTGAARNSGLNAFAMAPAVGVSSAFSPAATGGGSAGYNENLRKDAW